VGKVTRAGVKRTKADLKNTTDRHMEKDLHIWCFRKKGRTEKENFTYEDVNRKVGESIIRVALKNLRRGLGSADLMADLDFLHSTGAAKSQKNDSLNAFYEIQDDSFEIVSEEIKTLFSSGKVTELAATLDKVTINHTSFTVLITFFFYEGRIFCCLNKLVSMTVDSYDARGTAHMVVTSLMETMGLTRTRLATLLTHFR
jgi:hypothetical protein